MIRKLGILGAALAVAALAIAPASAAYPDKPVKVIVPFAPAGPTDVMARLIAQKLSESLKQQFFVENHPGAGGNLGMMAVARSAPDGYTILVASSSYTVNPSLWRQAKLNMQHGLFEVAEGVYQVRGFDLSNITFIEGKTGFVVIDPLISAQPAAAALKLMREHRGDKPVTGVIYTHSHVDHYGGIRGVISQNDIDAGMQIVAPEGFLKAAVSENVLAGNAMGRRATYMYGALLPRDAKGHVDSGLGKTVSMGSVSLVPPTVSIRETGERLTMDGV